MYDSWFDRFNDCGDACAVWMATATIEAFVVLLIVGTIWLLIRRRVAPQVGVWLFLLVPLKLLIPIQVPAPTQIASWTPSSIAKELTSPNRPTESRPKPISRPEQALRRSSGNAPPNAQQHKQSSESKTNTIPPTQTLTPQHAHKIKNQARTSEATTIATTPNVVFNTTTWLMSAWATIVGFLFLRFLRSEIRFRRQLHSASPVTDDDLQFDFQKLSQSAGVTRSIRLLRSDAVTAPAVHGILRPSIILPTTALDRLTPTQLRWALLHELSHIRRHDLAFILFQRVVSWLFFFHPAVWVANRIVHQLREFACDDRAILQSESLQSETPSTDAGEAFLQILRSATEQPQRDQATHGEVALSVLGFGPRASCRQRLKRMLDTDRRITSRPGWISICGLLLIAAMTLPHLSAAIPDEPTEEPAATQADAKTEAASQEENAKAKTWRFDLQVIDTAGEVVPNAMVEMRGGNLPTAEQMLIGKLVGKNVYGVSFECDEQGKLSADFPGKPISLRVFIKTDGYGPYYAGWAGANLANQIPHQFTAELEHAWTMGGRVTDEAGNPVAGVEIRPSLEFKKRPGDQRQFGTGDRLKTDDDGRWEFRRAPNSLDSIFAEIDHAKFQPQSMRFARTEFEIIPDDEEHLGGTIVLSKGLSLSGQILNEQGESVIGATVRIKFRNDERRTKTGMDGRYTIGGCEARVTEVAVSAPGMAIEKKEVSILPGGKDVDFVLKPSKGIRIRVVDEAGKPLARSRIFFQEWRGDHAYFAFDEVNQYADENGVWEWKEAPLDEFTADICRPKGMNLSGQTLVARKEEYVFTPPPQLFVSGTVTDAKTGEKVKAFRVVPGIEHSGNRNWIDADAFKGSDGNYRVEHESQMYDAHLVRIEADGYKPVVSRNIDADEGQVTLDFKLEPADMIRSQVVDPEGKPVADALVIIGTKDSQITIRNGRLRDDSTYNAPQFNTDQDGNVQFPPVIDSYQLIILHDNGFARVIPEEMVVPRQIKLTGWAVLEGRYLIGSQPAKATPMEVMASGFDSYGKDVPNVFTHYDRTTDGEGNFRFDRVFPGSNWVGRDITWMVNTGATEVTSARRENFVVAAGETQQLQVGGTGVPIIGRLLPPEGVDAPIIWSRARITLEQDVPDGAVGLPQPKPRYYFFASADVDGSFRIDDVPAGDWILKTRITDGDVHLVLDRMEVTIEEDDEAEKKIGDLPTREIPKR